jgi:small subunit ribosomal protein S15e
LDFVDVAVFFPEPLCHTRLQAEMVGHYLAEFAMTYKPTRHGRPGVGGNKFVPLK